MATFMDVRPPVYWLSFPRIIDVPFEICVAILESWQRQDGGLYVGQSVLRWPIEHDSEHGTYRVEAGLARGPLRPPLRMRLEIDRWSPSRTALELIPSHLVRPTADYFRSGHLLMDSLTRWLLRHAPAQRPGCATATRPHVHQDARQQTGPGREHVTCAGNRR